MSLTKEACTARNEREAPGEAVSCLCLSDLGWNADGVAFVFFFFLIFLFGFREACQKDSLNLGGRLVDGRSGEALVWLLGNTDPRGERDREQRVRGSRSCTWMVRDAQLGRNHRGLAGGRAPRASQSWGASRAGPGPSDVKPRK